tara:strand:+ start:336 stop:497 length:162 start_codon:yes stop_codon:yes gene_type:complete
MSKESIGNQLKNERKRLGLSQHDIGGKLKTSRAQISRVKNGRYLGLLQLLERY